jgi:hypothetical protein
LSKASWSSVGSNGKKPFRSVYVDCGVSNEKIL